MNWGKGLVIVLIVFVCFITAMSVKMFSQTNDEYDHDYYEKGLSFNADYNKEQQVVKDDAKPQIAIKDGVINIKFKEKAKGSIRFVRPSDHDMDRYLNFNTADLNTFTTRIPFHGQWQVIIAWKSNDKSYLYQQEIFIK